MTAYHPASVIKALLSSTWPVGNDNASKVTADAKKPHFTFDFDKEERLALPSVEIRYDGYKDDIGNLTTSFHYIRDKVYVNSRSRLEDEVWAMSNYIHDKIVTSATSFTSLAGFTGMEYNLLEVFGGNAVNEYNENGPYYTHSLLVILHKPKVFTLS